MYSRNVYIYIQHQWYWNYQYPDFVDYPCEINSYFEDFPCCYEDTNLNSPSSIQDLINSGNKWGNEELTTYSYLNDAGGNLSIGEKLKAQRAYYDSGKRFVGMDIYSPQWPKVMRLENSEVEIIRTHAITLNNTNPSYIVKEEASIDRRVYSRPTGVMAISAKHNLTILNFGNL
jgi:hypothetical protein